MIDSEELVAQDTLSFMFDLVIVSLFCRSPNECILLPGNLFLENFC